MVRLAVFLMIFCLPLLGASLKAPLPEQALAAKTVYLINKSGSQDVADAAYDQFTKWGRLKVVTDKATADMIIVFTSVERLNEGTSNTRTTRMAVLVKGSEDPVYQTTERPTLFKAASSSARNCIDDLRKRIGQ